jgi:hypothetical protein
MSLSFLFILAHLAAMISLPRVPNVIADPSVEDILGVVVASFELEIILFLGGIGITYLRL